MTVITASPKGFQKLLDLQTQALGSLNSIQSILTTNKDDVVQQLLQSQLDTSKLISDTQQKQLQIEQDTRDNTGKLTQAESKEVAGVAETLKNWRTFGDDLHDMKKGFRDAFTGGNLGTTLMKAFNIGGIFDKKIRRDEFVKSNQAAGSDKTVKELQKDFEMALKISKDIANNEKAIADLKKTLGRGRDVSDDQLGNTAAGKDLLGKRDTLSGSYAAVDPSAALFGKGGFSGDEPSAPLAKTPSDFGQISKSTSTSALETATKKEQENETLKTLQAQTDLLQQIADGITKMVGGADKTKSNKMGIDDNATGGLGDTMSNIFSMLGDSLVNVISKVFSFRSILKFVTKFFAPAMIIGALANGIIDGFKAFMDTGSISEALIAGFGGVLEFISFGLFDKDTLKDVINVVSGFVQDYIVQPISDFVDGIGDAFKKYISDPFKQVFDLYIGVWKFIGGLIMDYIITPLTEMFKPVTDFFSDMVSNVLDFLKNIEIPGISFKIPFKDDPVTFGPWHPFQPTDEGTKNVSQVTPTSAGKVIGASKDNADASAMADAKSGGNTANVVNAPVTNNSTTNQVIKPNVRNQESSQSRYLAARY